MEKQKEKNVPLTIRLPESRVNLIKKMAEVFHVSPAKLASIMLEAGFVLTDNLDEASEVLNGKLQ